MKGAAGVFFGRLVSDSSRRVLFLRRLRQGPAVSWRWAGAIQPLSAAGVSGVGLRGEGEGCWRGERTRSHVTQEPDQVQTLKKRREEEKEGLDTGT